VAEPDELALHPPVPPGRIVCRDADTSLRIAAGRDGRPGGRRFV
jgi:hypothetical protein